MYGVLIYDIMLNAYRRCRFELQARQFLLPGIGFSNRIKLYRSLTSNTIRLPTVAGRISIIQYKLTEESQGSDQQQTVTKSVKALISLHLPVKNPYTASGGKNRLKLKASHSNGLIPGR
jgi:hypothetical protein